MPTHIARQRVVPLEWNSDIPKTDGSLVTFVSSVDNIGHNLIESHEDFSVTGFDTSFGEYASKDNNSNDNSNDSIVSLPSQSPRLQQPRRSSLRSADRRRDSRRSVRFSIVDDELEALWNLVFESIENDKPRIDGFSVTGLQESHVLENKFVIDDRDDELEALWNRDDLGWRFSDTVSDIETHEYELEAERNTEYMRMIQDHIERVERKWRERELINQQKEKEPELINQRKEKKGFKSKVLKPLWKGFLEATSRS
ncbi:hypothetical protein ACHAXA_008348 [Cyclostephanos tholiformis]|uniref:Uncharacterized protein n=1 Tax=Cyclostephanos tholiformis TaxID=382380 RepID=A0ABD3R7B9_9STRA